MAAFLGSAQACAGLAGVILLLATGCGARHSDGPRHSHGPGAVHSGTAPARPGPKATGYVKRADFLTGVACTSTRACVAVGSYYYGAGPSLALAVRWNGRAWQAEPTPSRGNSQLSGVSCASAVSARGSTPPPRGQAPGPHGPGTPRWPEGPSDFVTGAFGRSGWPRGAVSR